MKPYHEISTVISDESKIVGFYVYEGTEACYKYVDLADFVNLVKNGQVQYLEWDQDAQSLKVEYSKEELKAMGKAAAKATTSISNIEDYLKNDSKLLLNSVRTVEKYPNVLLSSAIATPKLPIIGTSLIIMVFGTEKVLTEYVKDIPKKQGIASMLRKDLGIPKLTIQIPSMLLKSTSPDIFKGLYIDTLCLAHVPDIIKSENVRSTNLLNRMLYGEDASAEDLDTMALFCRYVNCKTIEMYQQLPEHTTPIGGF